MRLYSFVNYYLSPIQHGIQTAHCVSELSWMYKFNTKQAKAYYDWAKNHKTVVVLNGGNSLALDTTYWRLSAFSEQLKLPVTRFYEDEQSLNRALTAVAIILPENLYDVEYLPADPKSAIKERLSNAYVYDGGSYVEGRDVEYDLISLVKSHRLA